MQAIGNNEFFPWQLAMTKCVLLTIVFCFNKLTFIFACKDT